MLPFRSSAVFIGVLLSATIQAGVYRWVDENGVTVYSQVPPPTNIEKKEIAAPPPPPVTGKEAWKEVNQEWKKMRDRQDTLTEQATADSEKLERKQSREKNCVTAKRTLKELKDSEFKYIKRLDGEMARLSAAERAKHLDKAREMEKEHCD